MMYDRTSERMGPGLKSLQYSSNPGSTTAAHQAHLLPGQLLEPGAVSLGLDEGSNWVATSLDNTP